MNLIEEGMVVENSTGVQLEVQRVTLGRYGILAEGYLPSLEREGKVYILPELPPLEFAKWDWYGWATRSHALLPTGLKVGAVAFYRNDPRPRTLEDYDAEWERTIDTIRKEEQEQWK